MPVWEGVIKRLSDTKRKLNMALYFILSYCFQFQKNSFVFMGTSQFYYFLVFISVSNCCIFFLLVQRNLTLTEFRGVVMYLHIQVQSISQCMFIPWLITSWVPWQSEVALKGKQVTDESLLFFLFFPLGSCSSHYPHFGTLWVKQCYSIFLLQKFIIVLFDLTGCLIPVAMSWLRGPLSFSFTHVFLNSEII